MNNINEAAKVLGRLGGLKTSKLHADKKKEWGSKGGKKAWENRKNKPVDNSLDIVTDK